MDRKSLRSWLEEWYKIPTSSIQERNDKKEKLYQFFLNNFNLILTALKW